MSNTTFDLIRSYVDSHENKLPPDARNALDVLCNNIKLNKREWEDPNAEQIIKSVEEETLKLIHYYEQHHAEPSTFSFNKVYHRALLTRKLDAYKALLTPSVFKTSHLFWYQKLILALVVITTCVVCAVIGMTLGIAIGATIGGGVGSAAPALGTAFGGIVGGGFGGIVGAIKGLAFGTALGAAIGFAVLGALGAIAGWFIGKRMVPKQATDYNGLDQAMKKFASTLAPDYVAPVPMPASPRRATATAPVTPGGSGTPFSPLLVSASAPVLGMPPARQKEVPT
jgi:hypothetical protein